MEEVSVLGRDNTIQMLKVVSTEHLWKFGVITT